MVGMYNRVVERMEGMAVPSKPVALSGEYSFPEDPTLLAAEEIGRWMFSLSAWNGFVLRNLALADLLAAQLKSNYEKMLNGTLLKVEAKRGKTKNQMALEAQALNPNIEETKEMLDEANAEVWVWERLHKIYESQIAVLSREISRRLGEQRTEGNVLR